MTLRVLADYACNTGEGPLWHPTEQRLYWTDIPNGSLYSYDWDTGEHRNIWNGPPVGGMTLQEDGVIALFMAKGAIALYSAGEHTTIVPLLPGEGDSRFNDVIADPLGRVFAGTMSTDRRAGTLYRIDRNLQIHPVIRDVGCSNGMGFTNDRRKFFHVDSTARLVSVFDYDELTGEIENRRDFLREPDVPGGPDGMTVDVEDCLWIAYWDGSCLVRYDPEGREMLRIPFPAKKVSSVTFGGEGYEDMFVTTAGGQDKAANGADAGAVFHLKPGVAGKPEFRSRIGE